MHRSSSRNKNTSARLIITLILRKGTTRASRLGNHHLLLALIAVAIIGIMVAHHAINLIGSTIIWNSSSIHCVSPVRMSQRRPLTLITVHNASKIYDIRVWVRLELSTRNLWTFTKVIYRLLKWCITEGRSCAYECSVYRSKFILCQWSNLIIKCRFSHRFWGKQ